MRSDNVHRAMAHQFQVGVLRSTAPTGARAQRDLLMRQTGRASCRPRSVPALCAHGALVGAIAAFMVSGVTATRTFADQAYNQLYEVAVQRPSVAADDSSVAMTSPVKRRQTVDIFTKS